MTGGPLEPHFGVDEQKCLIGYKRGNEARGRQFPKLCTVSVSVDPLTRYREIATRTWPKINTFVRFAADRK